MKTGKTWILVCCLLTMLLSVAMGGAAGYFVSRMTHTDTNAQGSYPDTTVKTAPQKTAEETKPVGNTPVDEPSPAVGALTVTEVAQKCTKSVVNITIKERSTSYTGGNEYTETVLGHGTGVIMREDGYIVTCHHVVDGADSIYVTFDDETECEATLVGADERFDLAVIRVDMTGLPAAEIGDSDEMISGEGVVVIGNPLGEFGSSVSAGVLSAPTREVTIEGVPLRLMQTDAAVNPGNSGGGMFNMRGQWVGMVNAKMSASGIEGIGFAIPLNSILQNIDSIITSGKSSQAAVLGVSTKNSTCYIDGKNVECLEIVSVKENSAAAEAGLQPGDYLLSVDGKTLDSNDTLALVIKYHSAGDQVEFEVYRGQEKHTVTATLK